VLGAKWEINGGNLGKPSRLTQQAYSLGAVVSTNVHPQLPFLFAGFFQMLFKNHFIATPYLSTAYKIKNEPTRGSFANL
jgi:hypothetical protein